MRNFFALLMLVLTISLVNAQDTLFMYKAGAVISKYALPDVDSITFVRGTKPIVKDIDGNEYDLVVIGTQTWFRQNLKTTRYNDGTAIPLITSATDWSLLSTGARCYYNNDSVSYKTTYGALYNWYVVNTNKLCPTGFHVPNDGEWTILTDYLGGLTPAGGKMKEAGLFHWMSPNSGATNTSGFAALPEGSRSKTGAYLMMYQVSNSWSSTAMDDTYAWTRYLQYNYSYAGRSNYYKQNGLSVRCLKD